ncbi:hypothetical protein BDB00DRAFT_795168 [Zychaea mexicana]|uniref:uncharacterized protein n=1 Tax=Zychaea mexicana TaxID=64656 RepID=UPI0022FDFD30|nr:uncharacterized protein BDB00DRAFT_795168 [Zychaea mexicana]KAI9499700.1 hypothetical protein BDB00DRAFT_795168 [Zychaea mexicana]
MASYFDDLNIKTTTNDRRQQHYNVDLDDFMGASPSTTTRRTHVDAAQNLQQLMQTAQFFGQFRDQMQATGNRDQEQFLDDLVSQLLEESQSNAKGPPPASQRFIRLLPKIKASQLDSDETCIICKDNLKASESGVTQMPCGHYFDRECLVPWLELHNTCPLCRLGVETEQAVKEEEEEEARDFMYS